ncbi:MAG: proline racemase family protein [Planctomycetaceae bacterium]|nr:proline racemase family protein [Planctomycetaceae bacterium]
MKRIRVIDSHTGGEPTRLIVEGGPELRPGSLTDQRAQFHHEFDFIRSALINEPRGADVLIGGLIIPPVSGDSTAGVIYFNNTGFLNMCGHGTIGLAVTLAWLGRISPGAHRIDTPVGVVTATLHDSHRVSVTNVPSYRFRARVPVEVEGHGTVTGDIAWGGNWFFLVSDHGQIIKASRWRELTEFTERIRTSLLANGITGKDGGEIDHIELFGPPETAEGDSRNFVLCPGGAFDRSPCGTGTSAKMACLAADGKLQPGQIWRQESIIGSVFEGTYESTGERVDDAPLIIPTITGTAWVTGDATLLLDPNDPFCHGIRF